MARRNHFTKLIKCPSCDNQGWAKVSENNDYEFMRGNYGFRIDALPSTFSDISASSSRAFVSVKCAMCEDSFRFGDQGPSK